MEVKVFKAYMWECELFGWTPSFAGANAYNRQVKLGIRKKWTAA